MSVRQRVRCFFALAAVAAACGGGGSGPKGTPSGPTIDPPPIIPQTVVMIGAGDIGDCSALADAGIHARDTARMMDSTSADAIFTAGDNAYPLGSSDDFNCYDSSWGRFKSKTFPVPGNHEYYQPGALPYFQYFGARAGEGGFRTGYYSFNLGNWHIVALNSPLQASGGIDQIMWLKDDLQNSNAKCTMAIFHYPVFTSGPSNGSPESRVMREAWQVLFDSGADLIVNGHDHLYERFAPQSPDGRRNDATGITQIIVGTGGAPLYQFSGSIANSAAQMRSYGLLKLTLQATSFDSVFLPVAGAPFDQYHGTCH
jgi:Calcineurin-like phosphoesterase